MSFQAIWSLSARHELEGIALRIEAERLLREIDPNVKDCGTELAYDSKVSIQCVNVGELYTFLYTMNY
jgi:hypothetical protein